jgi:hypothetical protein
VGDWEEKLKPKVLALIKSLTKRQRHEARFETLEDFTDEIVVHLKKDAKAGEFEAIPTPLDLLDFKAVKPLFDAKKDPTPEQWEKAKESALKQARKWQKSIRESFKDLLPPKILNALYDTPLFERASTTFKINEFETSTLEKKNTSRSKKKVTFKDLYEQTQGLSAEEVLKHKCFYVNFDPKINRLASGRAFPGTEHVAFDKAASKLLDKILDLAGLPPDASSAQLQNLGKRFVWRSADEKKVAKVCSLYVFAPSLIEMKVADFDELVRFRLGFKWFSQITETHVPGRVQVVGLPSHLRYGHRSWLHHWRGRVGLLREESFADLVSRKAGAKQHDIRRFFLGK